MSKYENEFTYFAKIILFVVVVGVLLAVGSYGYKYVMAPVAGKANAEWKIESADSRIAGYEKFFDQCAAIQGYESAIQVQQDGLLAATTPEDKSRIQTVIAGIKAQRSRAIAQYNADARKTYTSGRFKDAGLPQQIDDSVSGSKTVCVN